MRQAVLTEQQYRDLTKQIVRSIEMKSRIVPLNTLNHPKYYLKTPVCISLEYDGDTVIAGFSDIEAFSFADTEYEAIGQLCEQIVMLFEDLASDEKALGPSPKKWLAYLREIIGCR